jgi:hypothetical protein
MKRNHLLFIIIGSAIFVSPTPLDNSKQDVTAELSRLAQLGIAHRYLDDSTIELRDTIQGWTRLRTLNEPNEATIRNWAAMRGIPVIEIDPTQVDTSQWTGWYNYWTYVLVSNADNRVATQAYDFDGNGFPEVYGLYGGIGFPSQHRIYEVYPDGTSLHRYTYPIAGLSTQVLDVDRNGLMDIAFNWGQYTYVYEQPTPTSLPTQLKCAFNKYDGLAAYLSIEPLADMDGDSVMDFVHRGADTTISPHYLACVSEYDSSVQNFQRTWCTETIGDGFNVGDYDADGRMEIVESGLFGQMRVVENTGDNTYATIFQDTLPLVNMFHQTSGDIDGDGKREFFVGATMGSGNWTVMYEADSNNHYSPRVVLHLLSGGSLDNPTYFCRDVNNDGQLELVILSGGWLYVFKSNADDSYYLWYLKKGPSSFTVNFHDMDGDGIQDILWSSIRESRWATDIFRGSPLVGVGPEPPTLPQRVELLQNYPNPFNPATRIQYILPQREHVILRLFDLLGKEVAVLVDEIQGLGTHSVQWNGSGIASGIYLYQLRTSRSILTRKMILLR